MVGMSKGEEKEFKLKLPDDYVTTEIAGKEVNFKVKVLEVKEEKLPALDDAFAQQIASEYKNLEMLRAKVAESLKLSAEEQTRVNFEQQLIKAAVEKATANFPPVLVEMEINRLLNEQARQLQLSGISMEVYLQNIKKTEAQLREELRPAATRNIIGSLVLDKIAEVEKIEVGDRDVSAEIERIVGGTVENRKEEVRKLLATPENRDSLLRSLLTRKTMDRLVTIAGGPEEKKTEAKEAKKNE
jgi:trigger factor